MTLHMLRETKKTWEKRVNALPVSRFLVTWVDASCEYILVTCVDASCECNLFTCVDAGSLGLTIRHVSSKT